MILMTFLFGKLPLVSLVNVNKVIELQLYSIFAVMCRWCSHFVLYNSYTL